MCEFVCARQAIVCVCMQGQKAFALALSPLSRLQNLECAVILRATEVPEILNQDTKKISSSNVQA